MNEAFFFLFILPAGKQKCVEGKCLAQYHPKIKDLSGKPAWNSRDLAPVSPLINIDLIHRFVTILVT